MITWGERQTAGSGMSEPFDTKEYWEGRHAELCGDLRNVGNRGLTPEQNARLVTAKAVRVANLLGTLGYGPGTQALDAGCGAGACTRMLADGGFVMAGIDVSPTAIEDGNRDGHATYRCGTLHEFIWGDSFQVVLCLDVLFHVVDDQAWRDSLANLAGHVLPGGHLIIIEFFARYGQPTSPHVRWRSQPMYEERTRELGLQLEQVETFAYPEEGETKTLMVLRRPG